MSKLGNALLFSIVFECTFAVLYFGHVLDLTLRSLGSNQNASSILNGATSYVGGSALQQFVGALFSNPVALGIIWSVLNALVIIRITLKSRSRI